MRIAIPTRFKTKYVILFIALVFAGQEIEGTNIVFALLTALFTGLWAAAFNVAGGLEYPSGAFIFANGLFSVVIGLSAKVLLFEPGGRNLLAPNKTMFCYCVGMFMMLGVCFLVKILRPARPLISGLESLEDFKYASIACLAVALVQTAVSGFSYNASGTFLSAIRQIGGFSEMAIVLATTYEIRRTNGRRSVNWVTRFSIAFGILYGLVYFGKTGMLSGILDWAITASIQGYNFKKKTIVGLSFAGVFMVYYLVPYSQYVRNLGSTTRSLRENVPVAIEYLSDLNRTRNLYLEGINESDINDGPHLYDQNEGFLDRLIIVAMDDDIVHYTDQGNVFGLSPTVAEIANVVPHFIWKNKPLVNVGNTFAHELDLLPEDDETTGIAFSVTADAYHEATWLGILLIEPLVLFTCFIVLDSLGGSARYSTFALLPIIALFNGGVTGGLGLPISEVTYGVIALLAVVWVSKKLTPLVMNTIRQRMSPPAQGTPAGLGVSPTFL
jgi:hypothetical protein